MENTQPNQTTVMDIASMNEEELAILRKQMRELRKKEAGKRNQKTKIVDRMLHEKRHTTEEIWIALHEQGLEPLDPATTKGSPRTRVLKSIQARYQKLSKEGKDVGTVRMVPAFAKTSLDINAVLDWCVTASESDLNKLREELGAE